jgi:cystathionine beta-synthase
MESHLMTRDLLTKEGLYVGVSSGSAVVGAMKWVRSQGDAHGDVMKGKKVLVILPDSGNRYLSKVFNDDWMREAGFLDKPSMGTVADILHARGPSVAVIMAKQTDKVSTLIELLRSKSISQVPVVDDAGWVKGVVTEGALLSALYEGRVKGGDTIVNLVDASVEFVTPADPVEKVSRLVSAGKTPLVNDPSQGGKFISILTKIDLLTYLGNRT